jgi:two-component system NtrC family sensor kinase
MHREIGTVGGIPALIKPLACIAPDTPLDGVAELFRDIAYADVLSLPVVEDGIPIGVISRYRFIDVYSSNIAANSMVGALFIYS